MISNQAQVTTSVGNVISVISSNVVQTIVAERLDVTLTLRADGRSTVTTQTFVPVLLTNAGTGAEQFDLSARTSDGSDHALHYYVDRNGDGRVGAADDALGDLRTPRLRAGEQLPLIAIIDDVPASASITLIAAATTGSGKPGTIFADKGDGGGDAVVGPTGARAEVIVASTTSNDAATLTKTQAVRDSRGGNVAEPGAVITYTLVARFDGAAASATISDPVPAGTVLVSNSMTLDGAALTDAADADAGEASASAIRVALGAVPAAAPRTVTFQVVIQ